MFWDRFYALCISKGTKPNPVAKEIGISSGVVTRWKNEGTLPSGETLVKLADYLNCSVDYLLGREPLGDSLSVSASNISGGTVVQGKQTGNFVFDKSSSQSSIPSNTQNHVEEEAEILRILNTIGVKGRTELLSYAFALEEKHKGSA